MIVFHVLFPINAETQLCCTVYRSVGGFVEVLGEQAEKDSVIRKFHSHNLDLQTIIFDFVTSFRSNKHNKLQASTSNILTEIKKREDTSKFRREI